MNTENETVPSTFRTIIVDFVTELSSTFPEYSHLWSKWTKETITDEEVKHIFEYCISVYPERFFDVLCQNDDLFTKEENKNTFFLPNVDFKLLYNCTDVTENTKKAMWKYLQWIMLTIVNEVKDKNNFGDTMKLFDNLEENELQEQLKTAIDGITGFFKNIPMDETAETETPSTADSEKTEKTSIPQVESIKDHLKSLFDGKIGKIAKEMAEEISGEFTDLLGEDAKNIHSTADAMSALLKNPKRIMDLMKTVSGKLDSKMSSGEISKEELMKEATDIFGKMKNVGGGENNDFADMFKNLTKNMGGMAGMANMAKMAGMAGMSENSRQTANTSNPFQTGKNTRIDQNAMTQMMKSMEIAERLRNKVEAKKNAKEYSLDKKNEQLVFRLEGEEQQEKTYIHPDIQKEIDMIEEEEKVTKTNSKTTKKKKNKASK
jgi:hypothetical protein